MDLLDSLSKIGTILSGIGVVFVAYQAILIKRQITSEHEKCRREKTVDLLFLWSKELKKESSLSRKVVENFNDEQCRHLFNDEVFCVSENDYGTLCRILDFDNKKKAENGRIQLELSEVTKLRWTIISYLNLLESILVAWHHEIVDKGIIEKQFAYIFSPENGYDGLENFRKAAGGAKAYPVIYKFIEHLKNGSQHLGDVERAG